MSAVLNLATEEDDDGKAASEGAAKGKTTKGKTSAQITDAQSRKLFAMSMEQAKKIKIKQKVIVDDLLAILGYESTKDIKKEDVDKCLKFIEHYGKNVHPIDRALETREPDDTTETGTPDAMPDSTLDAEKPPF